MSPITVDDDLLPTAVIGIRLRHLNESTGWLQGELRLEEMWRMVDRIRVGQQGFALIVANEGQLVAHGDPNEKPRVARGDNLQSHPLVQRLQQDSKLESDSQETTQPETQQVMLAAGAPIRKLGWTVIVEQPAAEAYAVADHSATLSRIGCLLARSLWLWWAGIIRPISRSCEGHRRCEVGSTKAADYASEEFQQLDEFNGMADRLVELRGRKRKSGRRSSGASRSASCTTSRIRFRTSATAVD